MFRRIILPRLVWIFYRLWSLTWRVSVVEDPEMTKAKQNGTPLIFAHWHGLELCIVHLVSPLKIATMTSTSKDGQLMDFTIRKLGGATSRGSSTRGGVGALKGFIRLMREGYRASMAVDGPKGPLHQVKPGVFELSRLAQAHVVPVGAACSNAIIFERSWNKAELPKPFSRVSIFFGKPWPVVTRDQSPRDSDLAQQLSQDIFNACKVAGENLR